MNFQLPRFATPLPIFATLLLAGCSGNQNALDPKGPQSQAIANLFWIFFGVTGFVWIAVVVAVALALSRRGNPGIHPLAINPRTENRFKFIVATLAVLTGMTVIVLTVLSYTAQAQLFGSDKPGLTLKVIGHRWWWEIQYEDPVPDRSFTTANEIHLPVGEPITVKLTSSDVIHSFWVPALMGKQDTIPGRENQIGFSIDKPGVYRGQCAEFCGLQHAHMGMVVFADTKDAFEAWRNGQIADAAAPGGAEQQRGQEVFLSHPCVTCHTIRGTDAGGRTGPDLTHLASRTTLAAGTLPLNRGSLAAWITDPHGIKPGVDMPLIPLEPDALQSLASYLEGLK